MEKQLILVNENDEVMGVAGKTEVHAKGLLHRAFSIFIFNEQGNLMLQKRAQSKYHSPGLWTNTCCGHPRIEENILDAATRRLIEEMGIHCELQFKFAFTYKALLKNKLIEHEIDHVFYGTSNALPLLNKEEAEGWAYRSLEKIGLDIKHNPDTYTEWFKLCFEQIKNPVLL